MIIKKAKDLKGNETGTIYYNSSIDGKNLAEYMPERKERRLSNGTLIKGRKAYISFNTSRLTLEWDKAIIDRAKPQYKNEIAEILELYKGVSITEHSYL